ncbi:hypothetical protein [Acrocarpospora sp. B8E8]|uniref:hypothetical protein n=1 Tax=Acrocarpospora sp. B8E8 TaxID=3153572 RepID=UPI00325FA350
MTPFQRYLAEVAKRQPLPPVPSFRLLWVTGGDFREPDDLFGIIDHIPDASPGGNLVLPLLKVAAVVLHGAERPVKRVLPVIDPAGVTGEVQPAPVAITWRLCPQFAPRPPGFGVGCADDPPGRSADLFASPAHSSPSMR